MKSVKLAMILLVGQCAFNPLAALSNGLFGKETQTTVFKEGNEYSCYAVERAGNYFKDGLNELCDLAGYQRQADYGGDIAGLSERDLGLTVTTYGGEYSCYYAEKAGNYFKKGIGTACDKAGYNRQFDYLSTNQDLVDVFNDVRIRCIQLSQGMGSTNPEVIHGCALVGVGVDAANLD